MNNRTRIVLLGLFAVLVAVWGSSASLTLPFGDQGYRVRPEAESRPAPVLFDVDEASTRLRNRQRESPAPRQSGRNPFEFARPAVTAASVIPSEPRADAIAPPPPSEPPPPLFTLSGVFAKVGDNVTARYTVATIGADAVELRDVATGQSIRLALQ
jgi:hypothetical protein